MDYAKDLRATSPRKGAQDKTALFRKKYLVTGGAGFIGSHLVDALIGAGHDVVVLDNLSTGKIENVHPGAQVIIGDTTHYETVLRAMEGADGCFHLAAIASVEKSTTDWGPTHTVNVTSTVNIFQAAIKRGKIPVVYTSSAAVYGDAARTPITETDDTVPLTAYGADKLGCDLHARVAWHIHKVPSIGLRPFNVYGPRQDPKSPYSGVISIFTDRILNGDPITINGDGEQVRDFVYVGDAVKTFITAMQRVSLTQEGYSFINMCTGRATSLNELIETIEYAAGRKVQHIHGPARPGDIRTSLGNPAKLKAELKIVLTVSLKSGLALLIRSKHDELERAPLPAKKVA